MRQPWDITIEREYSVDPDELRRDFAQELSEDGIALDDDEAVIRHCWDEGIREPYFEVELEEVSP